MTRDSKLGGEVSGPLRLNGMAKRVSLGSSASLPRLPRNIRVAQVVIHEGRRPVGLTWIVILLLLGGYLGYCFLFALRYGRYGG